MVSVRIEQQYQDEKDLYQYLMGKEEVSYATYVDSVYKKVLLLSAASYYESRISAIIINFARESSKTDQRLSVFIEKKMLERQYHTLFTWNGNNTNSFWALFGAETKDKVRKIINDNPELESAEKAFLELGDKRNQLVHQNFSEFDVNITIDEIYSKYVLASKFVELVATVLSHSFVSNS